MEQAARLTRCFDSQKKPAQGIETEYLLSSELRAALSPSEMLQPIVVTGVSKRGCICAWMSLPAKTAAVCDTPSRH